MSDAPSDVDTRNNRVLQAVSYLIEWAKHIITLGAALMVLSVTLLKDLAQNSHPPTSYIIIACMVLFYLCMLLAVWLSLRLIRSAARIVLTNAEQLGTGSELGELQKHLNITQRVFLMSLAFFSLGALSVLVGWAFGVTAPPSQ